MSFICDTRSGYYCFRNKYDGAEFNYSRGKEYCVLCRVPVEFYNFEEMLDRNQYNEKFLKKYLVDLMPYLLECYEVDKNSIQYFVFGEFEYSLRDNYGREKISVPLSEQIKYRNFLKERTPNGYFILFYRSYKKTICLYIFYYYCLISCKIQFFQISILNLLLS